MAPSGGRGAKTGTGKKKKNQPKRRVRSGEKKGDQEGCSTWRRTDLKRRRGCSGPSPEGVLTLSTEEKTYVKTQGENRGEESRTRIEKDREEGTNRGGTCSLDSAQRRGSRPATSREKGERPTASVKRSRTNGLV